MSIWVNKNTKIVVQGLTGKEGRFHAEKCRDYGSQVVAGVTPGKGGQVFEHGEHRIPIFNTVAEASTSTAVAEVEGLRQRHEGGRTVLEETQQGSGRGEPSRP